MSGQVLRGCREEGQMSHPQKQQGREERGSEIQERRDADACSWECKEFYSQDPSGFELRGGEPGIPRVCSVLWAYVQGFWWFCGSSDLPSCVRLLSLCDDSISGILNLFFCLQMICSSFSGLLRLFSSSFQR